jgi:indolepyruvate ferredoxin oxidoreductase
MTGGQRNDGGLTVPIIARQVAAEGAKKIVIVTDEPWKYPDDAGFPPGVTIHHRDDLMAVQTGLADVSGLSVLIYDQTCAAEKRRRRKRGQFPDPDKRVVINELVCEGCGDCGVQSNCVSVQPLDTEWGRKRTIDQSSCNKDFSCLKGFCPSFVTVEGRQAQARQGDRGAGRSSGAAGARAAGDRTDLFDHRHRRRRHRHRDHRRRARHGGASRGQGASASSIRPASRRRAARSTATSASPESPRTSTPSVWRRGNATSCWAATWWWSGNKKVLSTAKLGATTMVINTAEILPGDFTRNADFSLPTGALMRADPTAAAGDEKTTSSRERGCDRAGS